MLSRWSHRFSIALELNELSKEGTFRFRPALMNNAAEAFKCCASSAHCQFFSLNFAVTLSPQNVNHTDRIGWDSRGAAMRAPLPMQLGVTDHIWSIGELVDAASSDEAPKPAGGRAARSG
jgi:hypothetical protein